MDSFEGRAAIVTAGVRGIGAAISRFLADRGAWVLAASPEGKLEGGEHARIRTVRCRVTSERDVRGLFDAAVTRHRRVDILVNAAGAEVPQGSDVEEVSPADFDEAYRLCVMGTFLCCRRAVHEMRHRGSGAIVNVCPGADSSSIVHAGVGGAVVAFTRALARMAGPGIRVNALALDRLPGSRSLPEAAELVAMLLSAPVTGQVIRHGGD